MWLPLKGATVSEEVNLPPPHSQSLLSSPLDTANPEGPTLSAFTWRRESSFSQQSACVYTWVCVSLRVHIICAQQKKGSTSPSPRCLPLSQPATMRTWPFYDNDKTSPDTGRRRIVPRRWGGLASPGLRGGFLPLKLLSVSSVLLHTHTGEDRQRTPVLITSGSLDWTPTVPRPACNQTNQKCRRLQRENCDSSDTDNLDLCGLTAERV